MEHPILRSYITLITYIVIWLFIMSIDTALIVVYTNTSFAAAAINSAVFNFWFASLGIALWFPISYGQSKPGILNAIINHITSATILLLVWIGISMATLYLFDTPELTFTKIAHKTIPWRVAAAEMYYIILALLYYLLLYYRNLQQKTQNEIRLQQTLRETELTMLKSQINPHFLFNSLNSASSLTMSDPEKAQEMIIKLSDFLRYSVSSHRQQFSSLQTELENIERYLDIEKVRFGSKLQYIKDISTISLGIQIPAMLLQPLVENAIKHGVYESIEPIAIHITAKVEQNILSIEVINDFDSQSRSRKGTGTGLKNIRERLQLLYGQRHSITISSANSQFKVVITVPIQFHEVG